MLAVLCTIQFLTRKGVVPHDFHVVDDKSAEATAFLSTMYLSDCSCHAANSTSYPQVLPFTHSTMALSIGKCSWMFATTRCSSAVWTSTKDLIFNVSTVRMSTFSFRLHLKMRSLHISTYRQLPLQIHVILIYYSAGVSVFVCLSQKNFGLALCEHSRCGVCMGGRAQNLREHGTHGHIGTTWQGTVPISTGRYRMARNMN